MRDFSWGGRPPAGGIPEVAPPGTGLTSVGIPMPQRPVAPPTSLSDGGAAQDPAATGKPPTSTEVSLTGRVTEPPLLYRIGEKLGTMANLRAGFQSGSATPGTALARISNDGGSGKPVRPSLFQEREAALLAELGVTEVTPLLLGDVRRQAGIEAIRSAQQEWLSPSIAQGPVASVIWQEVGLSATSAFDGLSGDTVEPPRYWGKRSGLRPNHEAAQSNNALEKMKVKSIAAARERVFGDTPLLDAAQRAMTSVSRNYVIATGQEGLKVHFWSANGSMYVDAAKLVDVFELEATNTGLLNSRIAKVGQIQRADGTIAEVPVELHLCIQDSEDPKLSYEVVVVPGLNQAAGSQAVTVDGQTGSPVDWHKGWWEVKEVVTLHNPRILTRLITAHSGFDGVGAGPDGEVRVPGNPYVPVYANEGLHKAVNFLSNPQALGMLVAAASCEIQNDEPPKLGVGHLVDTGGTVDAELVEDEDQN
ncbi:hypothetical protein IPL85_00535 [Candidatus Saccharibacteria bacterium]|nr:MAG: hypothetical protein IPL85_00535 [Candidatus Saccharibacteria bacterium]